MKGFYAYAPVMTDNTKNAITIYPQGHNRFFSGAADIPKAAVSD